MNHVWVHSPCLVLQGGPASSESQLRDILRDFGCAGFSEWCPCLVSVQGTFMPLMSFSQTNDITRGSFCIYIWISPAKNINILNARLFLELALWGVHRIKDYKIRELSPKLAVINHYNF